MNIKEIMCSKFEFVTPDSTLSEIAQKMRENNTGSILVAEDNKMVGMITDRDIAIKVVNRNIAPDSVKANDIMSQPVLYCFEDQQLDEIADNMMENHTLRLFVVDRNKQAKGIVTHSDLADAVVKNNLYGEPLARKVIQLASKLAS